MLENLKNLFNQSYLTPIALIVGAVLFAYLSNQNQASQKNPHASHHQAKPSSHSQAKASPSSMFGNSSSAPKVELLPPKDDKFTLEELAKYNGQDSSLPIYVAVKDTVFDVSTSSSYGPEGGYKMFAGKNPNKALGKSSLKPDDCVPDTADFTPEEQQVLDDWHKFFEKRYNIVGKIVRD